MDLFVFFPALANTLEKVESTELRSKSVECPEDMIAAAGPFFGGLASLKTCILYDLPLQILQKRSIFHSQSLQHLQFRYTNRRQAPGKIYPGGGPSRQNRESNKAVFLLLDDIDSVIDWFPGFRSLSLGLPRTLEWDHMPSSKLSHLILNLPLSLAEHPDYSANNITDPEIST
ncbi:hypothetical protein ASPWEDRAFT_172708 [Aspergillus wentii DTO 134E9]|uniref:Uncharacterized protein n=1 Tax=Aspergillus wentii DTO 134E9 TaxID=1073089 RepID=A0A1L9RM08_ASPWE|nr:uncharacterized protein ASPWEDRAFT_172708 [Aspergillus wentii DTO 134E9]KAI9929629.1 hypothetical protein MW887_001103 [Aspergillus wentii]OJJ35923.1 hypothetical protein ASPWEDRAFT_172708 [Aspergillus wentii DTO 134E9]